jgi:uncharacterized protein
MNSGPHLLISGAGGLIGSALLPFLTARGYRLTRLTRGAAAPDAISWDFQTENLDLTKVPPIDAVVHLAGENIGTRWTEARKARIRQSRVQGTRLLSAALARLERRPRVLVSASATGIYGNRGDEILTESSPPGDAGRDFLVSVCREWEAAAEPARAAGIRVVHPRFGVVLSPKGGALEKLLPPFQLGLGGRQGNGLQWMSWIALDEVASIIGFLLQSDEIQGAVNVTAPEPVINREFAETLGRVLRRPAAVPVPAAALRLALGEMAERTILGSARVLPKRLQQAGYQFQYSRLEPALRHVLARERE